jgi:hypothetical protein
MASLYCPECSAYLEGGDGALRDCACGWRQPAEQLDSEPAVTKHGYSVGDVVTVIAATGDAPSGDSPGEKLIVRSFSDWDRSPFPIHVSHEHVTDGRTFGVAPNEIERLT